jgi:hypothetical protein
MLIFQYMSSRHGASPLSVQVFKLTSLVLVEHELIRIRSETRLAGRVGHFLGNSTSSSLGMLSRAWIYYSMERDP